MWKVLMIIKVGPDIDANQRRAQVAPKISGESQARENMQGTRVSP